MYLTVKPRNVHSIFIIEFTNSYPCSGEKSVRFEMWKYPSSITSLLLFIFCLISFS